MIDRCGVEQAALREEVEGKLLDISFTDYQKENCVEGVLPDKFWDAVVEEKSECEREDDVNEDYSRQFEEEELQIIGEEPYPVLVFAEKVRVRVVFLVIQFF